jgi:hypothetical protein
MVWFDANTVTWQATASAVAVWIINKMKSSNLPIFNWISKETATVNKWVGVVASMLVTIGLHWTFNYDQKGFLFSIGGTWTDIVAQVKDFAMSYGMQQGFHGVSLLPEILRRLCQLEQAQSMSNKAEAA